MLHRHAVTDNESLANQLAYIEWYLW